MKLNETEWDNVGRDRTRWDDVRRYGTIWNICEKTNGFLGGKTRTTRFQTTTLQTTTRQKAIMKGLNHAGS